MDGAVRASSVRCPECGTDHDVPLFEAHGVVEHVGGEHGAKRVTWRFSLAVAFILVWLGPGVALATSSWVPVALIPLAVGWIVYQAMTTPRRRKGVQRLAIGARLGIAIGIVERRARSSPDAPTEDAYPRPRGGEFIERAQIGSIELQPVSEFWARLTVRGRDGGKLLVAGVRAPLESRAELLDALQGRAAGSSSQGMPDLIFDRPAR